MVKIEKLSIEFNKKLIQTDLNFSVEYTESLAIIGKSDSGKSSLLNILGLLSVIIKVTILLMILKM